MINIKAYSQDLRDRVIIAYKEGEISLKTITTTFKICMDTAKDWIKRFETTGDYRSRQSSVNGRRPRFTDKQAVLTFIKNNPDADGIAIRDAVAPELPMSTFYDTLKRMEITFKKKSQNIKREKK
jgi:transposase